MFSVASGHPCHTRLLYSSLDFLCVISITTIIVVSYPFSSMLIRHSTGEFAFGKVDPHEAGAKGGHSSGGNSGSSEESGSGGNSGGNSGGSAKYVDFHIQHTKELSLTSSRGEFAHGKVDPHEAGKKGGKTSGNADDEYVEDE